MYTIGRTLRACILTEWVVSMSRNSVVYVAPNTSSVLEPTSDSDTSSGSFVSDLIPAIASIATVPLKEAAPLHVPHLYWNCLASGKEFPILFRALIDHGSSAVLISDEHVSKLGLHHKHLLAPYSAELAMESNGQKINILFSEYVKIRLHDPSSLWSSKLDAPL
jgi:hypothetical protein